MSDLPPFGLPERDLLVTVHADLGHVMKAVNGIGEKLTALDGEKADKSELERIYKEGLEVHSDHEKRLRRLEIGYFVSTGVLIALQFYFQYFRHS